MMLFMLIAMGSRAVPLSTSMYNGNCELNLGQALTEGATIYGNGSVPESDYADLTAYSKLIIKSSGGGLRMLFNRVGSNYLEISRDVNTNYFTWDGVETVTVDLDAIKANSGGIAHLNVIKNMYGYGNITVSSIVLNEATGMFSFNSDPTTWTSNSKSEGNNVISLSPLTMTLTSGDYGVVSPYNSNLEKMKFQKTSSCTFTCETGYKIIGITYQVDNASRNFTPSTGSVSALSGSPYTATWTPNGNDEVTSVTLTNGTTGNINAYNFVVTYEKLPNSGRKDITLSSRQSGLHNTYIDATNWYVRIQNTDGGDLSNNNYSVTFDNDEVARLSYVTGPSDHINNFRLLPLSVGKTTMTVQYLGDNTYNPTEPINIELTVNKHKTKLEFSDAAVTENYASEGTVSNTPTLTRLMDFTNTNPSGQTPTYTVKYSSSDPNVASVDENTGVVTMHNSGVTNIIANVVVTKEITVDGNTYTVEAYTASTDYYTLTVQGSQNQNVKLIWLSQVNPNTGSPAGSRLRGSQWTRENVPYFTVSENDPTLKFNAEPRNDGNVVNGVTSVDYGDEVIVQASAFTNLDWMGYEEHYQVDGQDKTRFIFNKSFTDNENNTYNYNAFTFRLKEDNFLMTDQGVPEATEWPGATGARTGKYTWSYQFLNESDFPAGSYKQPWTHTLRNGQTKTDNDVWMSNIVYSFSDPRLIDGHSEGERIVSGNSCTTKEFQCRPYPYMDENGNVLNDSITIYATIPGQGDVNPVTISTKLVVRKGTYSLTTEPEEGYVTKGEWVIPYVNIPDIKLKDIKKITVWFEDPTVGTVECEISTTAENGQVIYTLYEKDVTSSEWIRTKYDSDSKLDFVDMIYPKIYGLKAGETDVHIKVESPYYEDQECVYTLHVLADSNKPLFHWYANDDGTGTHEMNMGRDKGVNDVRTIHYGEDDGVIKDIVMFEGDFIHMPGIVGTANGNDEFSKAHPQGEGAVYLYDILNGNVELNWDPYYWREGIPNYFFTDNYIQNQDGTYSPDGDPLIPTNLQPSTQHAFVIKEIATGEDKRRDTLMVYGNNAGITYLWAQDPQTHLCCTPIRITVKSKAELSASKQAYLSQMTYPYTWDFEHMDMTNIENDVRNNGSAYWELIRVDEGRSPDKYQANGFFNADHDDKDMSNSGRQRWFKDLTAMGEYMPQFYGLMLNMAGLNYWDQKYNRFNVSAKGDYIEFVGGPHYLQLPGFGINPTGAKGTDESYSYTKYKYDNNRNLSSKNGTVTGKDGTRKFDNVVGGLHNHINTLNYTAKEGYEWVSNASTLESTKTEFATNDKYRNHKVRLVIVAQGRGSGSGDGSQLIHVGGKSMIDYALDENAINWSYNTKIGGDKVDSRGWDRNTHPGYSVYRMPNKRQTYVFELDPYDPEFQDHIYIMFNNDVKVYWMAISSEARELRSDYDNFSYAYPKDVDMDKTNVLMNIATKDGVTAKTELDGIVDKPNDWRVGTEIGFNAYYASKYNANKEALVVKNVKEFREDYPNRFAAGEGVIIYPSVRISNFGDNQAGLKTEKYNRTYTQWIEGEYAEKEMTVDGVTIPFVVPVCNTVTEEHKFQYLPTYFIANAQNVANYDDKTTVVKATTETVLGKSNVTMYREQPVAEANYSANYEGIGCVPLFNGSIGIPQQSAADDTHKTNWNNSVNLLRGAPYTTHILMDYNVTDNENGTIEAGTNVKGTMHATLTVATSENTSNTTWNRTNYTLTWNNTAGTQIKDLNLPSGNLTGYYKLVVNCASVKEDSPFIVSINFNGGDPEEYVISKTGESEFDLTILGDKLQNVKSITFGGNKVKAGKAVITDIYVTGPANDNRWINLGMSNEFVWRNLAFTDVKTMMNSLWDTQNNSYQNNTMYELIGPEFVRFYRANVAENMRNRRAYLSLTWNEYNVDTYGKGGVNYTHDDDYNGTIIQIPDGVVAQINEGNDTPTTNNGTDNFGQLQPSIVSVPGTLRRNPVRIVFRDNDNQENEDIVSEDGGFLDGIDEVEQTADFNAPFYNLNGVRVLTPSKGVYIQNGRKVVVR